MKNRTSEGRTDAAQCMICNHTITARTGLFMEDDQAVYGPRGAMVFVCYDFDACDKRAAKHIKECA